MAGDKTKNDLSGEMVRGKGCSRGQQTGDCGMASGWGLGESRVPVLSPNLGLGMDAWLGVVAGRRGVLGSNLDPGMSTWRGVLRSNLGPGMST